MALPEDKTIGKESVTAYLHVHPALELDPIEVDGFRFVSTAPGIVKAEPLIPGVTASNARDQLMAPLEHLSWDMIWRRHVAVEFQINDVRGSVEVGGIKHVCVGFEEVLCMGPGSGRKVGAKAYEGFDLLSRIRDYVIRKHLARADPTRESILKTKAELLLAVEHYVKGVMTPPYALAEFYSVLECIEARLGGRKQLSQTLQIAKADLDKIAYVANHPEFDQRHAPDDAGQLAPLPPDAIPNAASVAATIIEKYADLL